MAQYFVTGNAIDKINLTDTIQTMKLTFFFTLCMSISLFAQAQEASSQVTTQPTKVIGGVSDAKPSLPTADKVLPQYKINWSTVHQKRDHKVILNKIEAPAVVARQPIAELSQGEVEKQNQEILKWVRKIKESGSFFTVSATVYDHKATYVEWWNGDEKFAAWSNVDWNHLGGFHEFEGRGKRFSFMLFSNNTSMVSLKRDMTSGYRDTLPAIPKLPSLTGRGASYMVVKGDDKNDAAMEFIEAIHDLYAAEKVMLKKAYEERLKNWEISAAKQKDLRENPPPKPDVVINYWKKKSAPKTSPESESKSEEKE